MRTVIVSPAIQGIDTFPKGSATFVTHLSNLLRSTGDEITLLLATAEKKFISSRWRATYQTRGIEIIQVNLPDTKIECFPHQPNVRLSEQVAVYTRHADVVYFLDRGGLGFHTLRTRRFRSAGGPVCATVLHGPSAWTQLGHKHYPDVPSDLNQNFVEMYSVQHSDYVISPTRYMVDWTAQNGWTLPDPQRLRLCYLPVVSPPTLPDTDSTDKFQLKQLVYWGELETRGGLDLFMEALLYIAKHAPARIKALGKIVFLGTQTSNTSLDSYTWQQLSDVGYEVEILDSFDSLSAQKYLAQHVSDSLVVIPHLLGNFPYSVVEALLIPKLRLICSRSGGIPEMVGDTDAARLFDPYPRALAAKIEQCLDSSFTSLETSKPYDFEAANSNWLKLHEELCRDSAQTTAPVTAAPTAQKPPNKSVDVCVPFYNHGKYLPQLLLALENQTCMDFNVIVMDDGSTDAYSQQVFAQMKAQYADRGWRFFRQENAFVDAARNAASRQGSAEYLCFFDADDVPSLNMVERFLEAIRLSGDDCLVSPSYIFFGEQMPYDLATGRITAPAHRLYMPIGRSLVAGILDPAVFGGPVFIIRRSVFEAIGGFHELRGVGQEDFELHLRLILAGYKTDILPEYLQFYRRVEGGLSDTANRYSDTSRILTVYRDHLKTVGLQESAWTLFGLYDEKERMRRQIRELEAELARLKQAPPEIKPLIDRARHLYRAALPMDARLRFRDFRRKLLKQPRRSLH